MNTGNNIYELLYMVRMRDEYALHEIMKMMERKIRSHVNSAIARCRKLIIYRDDMVQEGMILLMKGIEYYREGSGATFNTYLEKIIRNMIIQYMQRTGRCYDSAYAKLVSLDEMTEGNPDYFGFLTTRDDLSDPVYYLEYMEAMRRCEEAICALNPIQKETAITWIEGGTYAERMERIGLTSYKQYESRLSRVRKKVYEAVISG